MAVLGGGEAAVVVVEVVAAVVATEGAEVFVAGGRLGLVATSSFLTTTGFSFFTPIAKVERRYDMNKQYMLQWLRSSY